MTTTDAKPAHKKSTGIKKSGAARRIGYIFSIIFMIVFIYILRHLRSWGFTFLTDDFSSLLFYIELSIYISIGINILFLLYDHKWFRHLLQGVANVFSALSVIMAYVIFPFTIEDETWVKWVKIIILVIFGFTVIGTLAEFIKGFRDLAKNPEKV